MGVNHPPLVEKSGAIPIKQLDHSIILEIFKNFINSCFGKHWHFGIYIFFRFVGQILYQCLQVLENLIPQPLEIKTLLVRLFSMHPKLTL